ncbi:MAG: cytochrome b/b6 domain-containing protein [Sterolibacteriaceae bacterium MAG5]|nr:cytochrome b/b6 domain-containing protein [Candidatus Nitricoxidireducens bremensis]
MRLDSRRDGAAASRLRLWDLPTRLFHWTLVVLVAIAFVSGFKGGNGMDIHGKAGIGIAGLLAFRLVWGFAGSTYARFASFVRGPAVIRTYLRGEWHGVGHNPLGALSVLALLGLLAFQVGTGLFGNDDIAFNGPLQALAGKDTSDLLTGLHRKSLWLLLALVGLHVAAIGYYARAKKENLVRPMITGWTDAPPEGARPASGGGVLAFLFAVAVGLLAACAASGAFLPPPPPPAASSPDW